MYLSLTYSRASSKACNVLGATVHAVISLPSVSLATSSLIKLYEIKLLMK
jgi:hypothetical protein